jgi:RNA polymerase sigma factor (sigma-70 family)
MPVACTASYPTHHDTTDPGIEGSRDLIDLVAAAAEGDRLAWKDLVDRYTPLVRHTIRRYRLSHDDLEDVSQSVWLRLVQHLHRLREPLALPGWLVTTTKNEALRVLTSGRRTELIDPQDLSRLEREYPGLAPGEEILRVESHHSLHDGLAELKPEHRELLVLLHSDPQVPYREISKRTGMPTGSIGPTRARCLKKLRATTAIRALL